MGPCLARRRAPDRNADRYAVEPVVIPAIVGIADRNGELIDGAALDGQIHRGLRSGRYRLVALSQVQIQAALRGPKSRKKWGPSEDELVAGATTPRLRAAIADLMGRSVASISRRQRRLVAKAAD